MGQSRSFQLYLNLQPCRRFSPPYDDVSELCGVSKAPRMGSSPTGHPAHTPSRLRSATESHKAELPRDQHETSTCETCNPTRGLTPNAKRKSICLNMFQSLFLINTDQNTPTELTFEKNITAQIIFSPLYLPTTMELTLMPELSELFYS